MTGQQQVSVGRVVHYVLSSGPRRGEHRAAIVTSAFGGENQNLIVLLDQGDDLRENGSYQLMDRVWSAPYDEAGKPGSWHWPERV